MSELERQAQRSPLTGKIKAIWTVGEATRIIATVFVAATISFGSAAVFTVTQINRQSQTDEVARCQERIDDRNTQLTALAAVTRAGSLYAKAGAAVLLVHPCPELASQVRGDEAYTISLRIPRKELRSP